MTTFMTYKEECEQLRQRVAELEEMYELSADVASTTLARNAELTAERDALKQQMDHIKMQARLWKLEARAQAMTVRECYQACTGSTGEPGDWNGALPVLAAVKERDKARQYWQIAEGRCDALIKQRDELLAALEYAEMLLADRIDTPLISEAIASVKEKQNAAD